MHVVARDKYNIEALVIIFSFISHNRNRLLFVVPVNAEHPTLWVVPYSIQCCSRLLLYWVELVVILVSAHVIVEHVLVKNTFTLAIQSKYPLHIFMVVFLLSRNKEVFNRNCYSEFTFTKVDFFTINRIVVVF